MIGTFFHEIRGDYIGWQGVIVANPRPGWYLVQLFSWIMGEPTNQRLVHFDNMKDWMFYPDGEAMRFSWQHGVASRYRIALEREGEKKVEEARVTSRAPACQSKNARRLAPVRLVVTS
jgi:hypothetical protein